MKGIEIFCASQASTAICVNMEEASSSSPSSAKSVQLGGRAIDRHNPIIRDSRRAPCASPSFSSPLPPKDPKPQEPPNQKAKKHSASSSKSREENKRNSKKGNDQKKKSGAGRLTERITNTYSSKPIESILRRSWVRPPPSDLVTPSGSSRYLLTETSVLDGLSKYDPGLALTPFDDNNQKSITVHQDETNNHTLKPSTSSRSRPTSSDQVSYLHIQYMLFA